MEGTVARVPILAVCAIVRDEATYIEEWVEFHRQQGVTEWRIYDDGSVDGTSEVLRRLGIESTIWTERPASIDVQQLEAYLQGCRLLTGVADWVACIDVDEFLFGREGQPLREALAAVSESVGAIAVQQVVFGSGGHPGRVSGRVTDRFTRCALRSHPECRWFKTVVRPSAVDRWNSAHSVVLTHGAYVLVDGAPFAVAGNHPGEAARRAEGPIGLHHYILKSHEEFEQKSAKWADRLQGQFKQDSYFTDRERHANAAECLELTRHPILAIATRTDPILVGRFEPSDLPSVSDFDALVAALSLDRNDDVAFVHAPVFPVELEPEIIGQNVFGTGDVLRKPDRFPTRSVVSAVVNDGIYSGNSLSILNSNFRLFASGIENVSPIERLASYDPVYRSDGDALYLNPDVPYTSTKLDGVLIPVCAAGAPNYGHYLFDGLGVAFMLAKLLPPGMVRLAGQGLKGWQKQIIDALGLSDVYVEVRGPVRFRKMVASTTLALHVTYPTAFARPVFDFMRFRFGSRERPRRNLFVSRRGMDHRFFANRDEIEILASSLGFDVVQPEQLPVADQVRLFASAKVVVGEAGAALANIGFCHPGTSVLEIQTAAFGDSWIRATCRIFGHRWHLFRAENIPPHTGQQMAFRVDPLEFRNAATAVLDGVGSRE